ncbi:MAG: hypothetical protein CL678_04080 [Bdellovibrionaceae bacterium]|nr:hypothetical protein [Pseudobdellovibrionaceae bacterium]
MSGGSPGPAGTQDGIMATCAKNRASDDIIPPVTIHHSSSPRPHPPSVHALRANTPTCRGIAEELSTMGRGAQGPAGTHDGMMATLQTAVIARSNHFMHHMYHHRNPAHLSGVSA